MTASWYILVISSFLDTNRLTTSSCLKPPFLRIVPVLNISQLIIESLKSALRANRLGLVLRATAFVRRSDIGVCEAMVRLCNIPYIVSAQLEVVRHQAVGAVDYH